MVGGLIVDAGYCDSGGVCCLDGESCVDGVGGIEGRSEGVEEGEENWEDDHGPDWCVERELSGGT